MRHAHQVGFRTDLFSYPLNMTAHNIAARGSDSVRPKQALLLAQEIGILPGQSTPMLGDAKVEFLRQFDLRCGVNPLGWATGPLKSDTLDGP